MRFRNRLKIITAYNDAFREMGEICERSIRVYAAIHNASSRTFREVVPDRPPAWSKIRYLIDEIRSGESEYVCWIDADACFVRGDLDLTSATAREKDIFLVKHRCQVAPISDLPGTFLYVDRPNTGVMLIRTSEYSLNFLEKIWNKTEYLNHPWWDQAALMDLMGYYFEISNRSRKNDPSNENLARVGWMPGAWNSIPTPVFDSVSTPVFDGISSDVRQDPMIVHFAGMPNELRKIKMQQLKFAEFPLGLGSLQNNARPILFLHIPKTAGTSLRHILKETRTSNRILNLWEVRLKDIDHASIAGADCLMGHFCFDEVEDIFHTFFSITFLRDPFARLISTYKFWRAHKSEIIDSNNYWWMRKAKDMDICEFYSDPDIRALDDVNNSFVQHLVRRNYGASVELNLAIAEQAIKNLQKFSFIGFQEHFESDVRRLLSEIQIDAELKPAWLNSSDNISSCEVNVFESYEYKQPDIFKLRSIVHDLVKFDYHVYDFAKKNYSGNIK